MIKRGIIKNKKAIELEVLGWIILGIITMVIVIIAYTLLTNKGTSALDFLKNLFILRR